MPSTNAFEPPCIPALLAHGFVRWQTIQILLDPDEHSQYLQNAVELWDIVSPDGSKFPSTIPRDAFPSEPDAEMVRWHEEVSRRLEYDYWKRNTPRPSPSFGVHYNYVKPNDGYFSRAHYRPAPYVDQDSSRRRQSRRDSTGYPSRVQSAYFPRPEGHRPGFASPRAPSPPSWSERPKSKKGKGFTFKNPFSFGTDSDASSEDSASSAKDRKRYGRRRNLGVEESHVRRHSHDAYSRQPRRDISPDYRHTYRDFPPRTRRHDFDVRAYSKPSRDDARPANLRYQQIPVDPVAIDAHIHPHMRYMKGTDHYTSRRDSEDRRRSIHSGSSGRSSGSGSDRSRSYNTGHGSRTAKWANPIHNPARCVPVCMPENVLYESKQPMYER